MTKVTILTLLAVLLSAPLAAANLDQPVVEQSDIKDLQCQFVNLDVNEVLLVDSLLLCLSYANVSISKMNIGAIQLLSEAKEIISSYQTPPQGLACPPTSSTCQFVVALPSSALTTCQSPHTCTLHFNDVLLNSHSSLSPVQLSLRFSSSTPTPSHPTRSMQLLAYVRGQAQVNNIPRTAQQQPLRRLATAGVHQQGSPQARQNPPPEVVWSQVDLQRDPQYHTASQARTQPHVPTGAHVVTIPLHTQEANTQPSSWDGIAELEQYQSFASGSCIWISVKNPPKRPRAAAYYVTVSFAPAVRQVRVINADFEHVGGVGGDVLTSIRLRSQKWMPGLGPGEASMKMMQVCAIYYDKQQVLSLEEVVELGSVRAQLVPDAYV